MYYIETSEKDVWVGTLSLVWSPQGMQLHMAAFLLADQCLVFADPEEQ